MSRIQVKFCSRAIFCTLHPKELLLMNLVIILALGTVFVTAQAFGEVAKIPQKVHDVEFESGVRSNPTAIEAVVWSQVIDLVDAPWVRLLFKSVHLESSSYLRITSHKDGETQILNRQMLAEWQNSTAYFNGSVVTVELVAATGTMQNWVTITQVIGGDPNPPPEPSGVARVCVLADGRVAAANAATARLLEANSGGGCTGFITNCFPAIDPVDRCMLSAGHCFVPGARDFQVSAVVQFNVPASLGTCAIQHPPVAKQFAVNPATVIALNGGPGNDYAVFRCFRNPNTSKTVFQEQGAQFALAAPGIGSATIYGYGVDGDPPEIPPDLNNCVCTGGDVQAPNNQTQQTHTAAITGIVGTRVDHDIHTCGGNSGSPIEQTPGSGVAVAIHESGGCVGGLPANAGTSVTHPGVIAGLAVVCPIPTLSQWGLIGLMLVLLTIATWVFIRRRKVVGVRT